MEERKALYRSLRIEAMFEAGYHAYLSPSMREVVLATADQLYQEKLEEALDGREFRLGRLARKWQPSLSA